MQELTEKVVLDYLALSGAEIHPKEDCYHVLTPLECAKELEGLPYPEINQYHFSFKTSQNPEHEVIRAGSSRLERIVSSIRKNSFLAQAFFPGSPLVPGLLVHFKFSYLTDQRTEELVLLWQNLVDGQIQELQKTDLTKWGQPQLKAGPAKLLEEKLTYADAYSELCEYARSLALARDDAWAQSARIRWREAIGDLEAHYQRALRERGGEDLAGERERRLRELEMRFRPRILAIPLSFALVYTPRAQAPQTAQ